MRDLSGFEMDEAVLVKKPKPIGWFAAGLIGILALGFVAAYYLPLQEAHATLLEKHEALAKKSNELDQTLKATTEELKKTTERKDALERFLKTGSDAESKVKAQLDSASSTAERQLAPYIKAKLVKVEPSHEALMISFSERATFTPHAERIVPQVQSHICKAISGLLTGGDTLLRVYTPVPADEKDAWELSGKRAAAIAELLSGRCQIPADKVSAVARLGAEGDDALRIELRPKEAPTLLASNAPSE